MIIGEEWNIYQCIENDNHLHVGTSDGELDELWVGDEQNKQHIIIGAADLKAALEKAGFTIVTKEFIEKLDKSALDSADWEYDRTGHYPKVYKPSEDPVISVKSK